MSDLNWTELREKALGELSLTSLPTNLKLPALPVAVTQYIERSGDPRASLKDLATILETDAGLTVELLRYVNSTYIGLRNKARTVLQAITLLGQRQSRMFVITTGMQSAVKSRQSRLINVKCFWNSSLQRALFAREVAELLHADTDLAFSASLIQDFLLPVLSNDLAPEYTAYLASTQQPNAVPLCEFERQHFGWNHAVAGACLATRWKLPDDIVCCILFHHEGLRLRNHPQLGSSAAFAVAVSAYLPDQLRQTTDGLERLRELESQWPEFHFDALVDLVDRKHSELGMGVENDYPLRRKCQALLQPAHQ